MMNTQQREEDDIGLRPISIADVLTRLEPPHEFIWGGYVPAQAATLLSAHGGVGKSGLALQLAMHVSMGLEFLGQKTVQAKTLFFSAEDSGGVVRRRIAAMCSAHQIDPATLAKNLHVLDATNAAILAAEDPKLRRLQATNHYEDLHRYIEANNIRFLVIDNSSDTYAGNNLDRTQVTQFVRLLARLVRKLKGAVLILAHLPKVAGRRDGKPSEGDSYADSAAWHNAPRSRLLMYEGKDGLMLDHVKTNYGTKAAPLPLERLGGCGVRLASADAFDFNDITLKQTHNATQQHEEATRTLLSMLIEFSDRGEWVSNKQSSPGTNPYALFKTERGFPKLNKAETIAIFREMSRNGLITAVQYKRSNRHPSERWSPTAAGRAYLKASNEDLRQPRQPAPTCSEANVDAVDASHEEDAPTSCVST